MIMNDGLAEVTRLTGEGLGGVKFGAIAIGTGALAPAPTQTALATEVTSGGGARKTAGDVTITLQTKTSTEDTVRYNATWAFTNSFALTEFGVFNDPVAGNMLLRQTFADPLNVVSQDALELDIDVTASDENVSASSVLTFAGIVEGNKLSAEDLTPASGRLKSIALGRGAVAPAQTDTALGDEILAIDAVGLARGQETVGPTVTIETENVADDTVVITSQWEVTGTIAVQETGSFTDLTSSTGVMFVRYVFADPLNLIATDLFTMVKRLTQVA